MDYLLSDPVTTPEGGTQRFTEQVLYLPETRLCFTPLDDAPEITPRGAGAPFTFGSFNRLDKINDRVVATWSEILQRVPAAKLVLQSAALGVPDARDHTRRRFAAHGVADEWLVLYGGSSHRELLARYNEVDLALDPFPYNGGATTLDALWMGVPVVALAGERMAGRQSVSMLRCAGLGEFAADDRAAYVELAVAKAFEALRRWCAQQAAFKESTHASN